MIVKCKNSIDLLEELQTMMFRTVLSTPKSTPASMLYWDFGTLKMKNRIIQTKLLFLHHLKKLPENAFAKEIFNAQIKYKFPGLVEECMNFISDLSLTDITTENITQNAWKNEVKSAIKELNEKEVKADLIKSKKSKGIQY